MRRLNVHHAAHRSKQHPVYPPQSNYGCRHSGRSGSTRNAQRGVVLIVALVILVAMSLGGIAIMRSVDTSTLIAGNIAFKTRTRQAADAGIEAATTWIAANANNLNTSSGAYYASVSRTNTFDWRADSSWTNATLVGTDVTGNTIKYVIHRMCDLPQSPEANNQLCATYSSTSAGGALGEGSSFVGGTTPFTQKPKTYFRVTVRSSGPRNAVSYLQAFILLSV